MAPHAPPPTNSSPEIPDLDLGLSQNPAPKAEPGVSNDRAAVKRGLLLTAVVLALLVIWCIWRGFS